MKNTELIKVEGLLNYKKELIRVKPLTQKSYTVEEAAEYFGCAKSQVKGYHSNYKDIIGDAIKVEAVDGKQKTVISPEGMFLLAILLCKKSTVAKEVFDRVVKLVISKKVNAEETTTEEEVAATAEAPKAEEKKEEKTHEMIKLKVDENGKVVKEVIRLNDEELAKLQEEQEERISKVKDQIKDSLINMLTGKKEDDTEEELIKKRRIAKDIVTDILNSRSEEKVIQVDKSNLDEVMKFVEKNKDNMDMAITRVRPDGTKEDVSYEQFVSDVKGHVEEDKEENNDEPLSFKDFFEKVLGLSEDAEEDEECMCEDCVKERFQDTTDAVKMDLIGEIHSLKSANIFVEEYMRRCEILGLDELESSVLVQSFITNYDEESDIDKVILNKLVEKKELEHIKKRGSLREFINLLAVERFDGEYEEAYHAVSNEMRYVIGIDMQRTRKGMKDQAKTPESYLDTIMRYDAYEQAMSIIHSMLVD